MGIEFNAAENAPPEGIEQAKKGQNTVIEVAATDNASLAISGGDKQRSFDEILQKSQNDLTKVKQIMNQGGFSGPEKDKYMLSLHHAEWVHSRNIYMKCDNNIKEIGVKYTALVDGKAQNHEITKAHKEWNDTREKCKKSGADLYEKANQYIETDRRVRANKKAEEDIYPPISGTDGFQVIRNGGGNVEGFTSVGNEIKEGFDFYNGSIISDNKVIAAASGTTPPVYTYNERLPRYKDASRASENDVKTILPWSEYYTDCAGVDDTMRPVCEKANVAKDEYINSINSLFDKADRLINTYYKLSSSATASTPELEKLLLNDSDIKSVIENQKKNIALYKQNALYDYEEYNSLAFYEDTVGFLYYALFILFLVMSLRDFFSSTSGSYDKRNIIILIILGIYPKYILPVVLWILKTLTKVTEMLGLKNVRFWRE